MGRAEAEGVTLSVPPRWGGGWAAENRKKQIAKVGRRKKTGFLSRIVRTLGDAEERSLVEGGTDRGLQAREPARRGDVLVRDNRRRGRE